MKPKYYIDLRKDGRYSWRISYHPLRSHKPLSYGHHGFTFRDSWSYAEDAMNDLQKAIWRNALSIKRKRQSKSILLTPPWSKCS